MRNLGTLITLLCATSLGALTAGCSDRQASPARLDVATTPKVDDTEAEWLKKQQSIHWVETWPDGTTTEREEDAVALVQPVINDCSVRVPAAPFGVCGPYYHSVAESLCQARTFLTLASPHASPIELGNGSPTYRVTGVTEAAAADLANYAAKAAWNAVGDALGILKNPPSACRNASGYWPKNGNDSAAVSFAALAVEGYQLGKEAYDRAIEATVNTSDKLASVSTSEQLGQQRAIVGSALSRAAAAHLLVGGDSGMLGSTTQPPCVGPELTPQGRSALQLIRDSGVPPSTLVSPAPTASILNVGSDSVRQRLGDFYSIDALKSGGTGAVEAYYNLSLADFDAARKYWIQEYVAFSRTTYATLPPVGSATQRRSAGVVGKPTPLPRGAWAARARYSALPASYYDPSTSVMSYSWDADNNPPVPPLDAFLFSTNVAIRMMAGTTASFAGTGDNATAAAQAKQMVMGSLNSILTGNETRGLLEIQSTATTMIPWAHGYYATDKVRIVAGEDGLRCAVQGNVEGATCVDAATPLAFPCGANAPTLSCLTVYKLTQEQPFSTPITSGERVYVTIPTGTSISSTNITNLISTKTRLYFVKLKDPALPEKPGNYELLGGSPAFTGTFGVPVVPTLQDRVADILEPSRDYCAVQGTTCTGMASDAKIPLENELTDDNNGVESSWRHYLGLADQAARESDLAGAELRAAVKDQLSNAATVQLRQEEQDQRAEDALSEVQSACGTAIDPKAILSVLSSGGGGNNLASLYSGQACTTDANCTMQPGQVCIGGSCVTDFVSLAGTVTSPDMVRLRDCLDERPSATLPFVTLGDKTLCVYTSTGNQNDVCPTIQGTPYVCPTPKSGTTCAAGPTGTTPYDAIPITYYKNAEPPSGANACTLIRKLRNTPSADDLNALIATNALRPEILRSQIGELGFVSKFGGFASITENGVERYSTGDISVSSTGAYSGSWPSVVTALGCPSPGSKGLFCALATTAAARSALHPRLFKATYLASWLLHDKSPTMVIPFGEQSNSCSQPAFIYPFGNTTNPVQVCGRVQGYLTGTSPGWYRPDGTSVSSPVRFMVAPGRDHFCPPYWKSHPGIVSMDGNIPGIFQALSSYGVDRPLGGTEAPFVRRALLGEVSENKYSDAFTIDGRCLSSQGLSSQIPAGVTGFENVIDGSFNQWGITYFAVSSSALLDAVELACDLAWNHTTASSTLPPTPPSGFATLEDIDRAGSFIRTLGDAINARAANMVFARVPQIAVDALGDVSPTGSFPAVSGRMGEEIARLRTALVSIRSAAPAIAASMQQLGSEMQTLRATLDQIDIDKQLTEWQLVSSNLDRLNSCAQSLGIGQFMNSFGVQSTAECGNAALQMAISAKTAALKVKSDNASANVARAGFAERISQLNLNLQNAVLGLDQAREQTNAALSAIDGLRKQARLAMAKALHLNSYQSAQQVAYTGATGALSSLAQSRYELALKNAKKMAFLAKRSIEERLGVRLSEMHDVLPLVDAPSRWEGTLCSLGGTDDVAENFPGSIDKGNAKGADIVKFGDAFIGDYVKNLSNLVESYSLAYNFHEGDDLAVISVRDDVKNITKKCPVPSKNLLLNAAELNSELWAARGCSTAPALATKPCMGAVPMTTTTGVKNVLPAAPLNTSGAAGYNLVFGDAKDCVNGCSWQAGAALSQLVTLDPGRYRFSWYSSDMKGAGAARLAAVKLRSATNPQPTLVPPTDPANPVSCFAPCGATTACPTAGCFSDAIAGSNSAPSPWSRYSIEFLVSQRQAYEVGFGVDDATRPLNSVSFAIAAPMLERVQLAKATAVGSFQESDRDGTVEFTDCEDTDGDQFRAKAWRYECTHMCDTGFSTNCTTGTEYCYHELSFDVSQPWIQNGKLFKFSGFARGNFNYRIDSLALNFVGSSVKNCENSENPSTCFNAGFVPYSIEHNGPFAVRNHAGADFRSMLFDGRIEHARGLALERYLTNPMSSTDKELLADYMRKEFQGRPLDGNFVIRVWDEPGVDFNAIQDIQLMLKYHYWTRFE